MEGEGRKREIDREGEMESKKVREGGRERKEEVMD